jgi:pimeloyl-ACP methyl ester carboxylesterase
MRFAFTGSIAQTCGSLALALMAIAAAIAPGRAADPPAAATTVERVPPVRLELTTGDRFDLVAWHYPVRQAATPLATVLLIHDLGGSHETIEPLALALQDAECSVLVPDLRGHGESVTPDMERAAGSRQPSDLLKKQDFVAMIANGGSKVRRQAPLRGDIEAVRLWLVERAGTAEGIDRLYVVGSGLGAALAAHWTNADAAWPPLTNRQQGGDVKGLVLIEPAFSTKGFAILPALSREPIKTELPVMIIAGPKHDDADKVFDQLKRWRPTDWFDSRLLNRSAAKEGDATLIFAELDGKNQRGAIVHGDAFASLRADNRRPDPAFLITAFIKANADRRP